MDAGAPRRSSLNMSEPEREAAHELVLGFLSSPECQIFGSCTDHVALSSKEIDRLFKYVGNPAQVLELCKFISDSNMRCYSFSELSNLILLEHRRDRILNLLAYPKCKLFAHLTSELHIERTDLDNLYLAGENSVSRVKHAIYYLQKKNIKCTNLQQCAQLVQKVRQLRNAWKLRNKDRIKNKKNKIKVKVSSDNQPQIPILDSNSSNDNSNSNSNDNANPSTDKVKAQMSPTAQPATIDLDNFSMAFSFPSNSSSANMIYPSSDTNNTSPLQGLEDWSSASDESDVESIQSSQAGSLAASPAQAALRYINPSPRDVGVAVTHRQFLIAPPVNRQIKNNLSPPAPISTDPNPSNSNPNVNPLYNEDESPYIVQGARQWKINAKSDSPLSNGKASPK